MPVSWKNRIPNNLLILCVVSLTLLPSAFATEGQGEKLLLCKLNRTVRTLRVEIDDGSLCKTIYTKQGVDDEIGSGQHKQSCFNIVGNVRKNLEEGGWKCREVQRAQSSELRTVQ